MWKRLKSSFESGIEKVKWFASVLNERMKVEISLVKLLYQSTEMEKKRGELLKGIGQRLYELKDGPENQIMRDPAVVELLTRLEALDNQIEEVNKRASEISRIEA